MGKAKDQGPGNQKEEGKGQGARGRDQGPGTRDQGPGAKDPHPHRKEQAIPATLLSGAATFVLELKMDPPSGLAPPHRQDPESSLGGKALLEVIKVVIAREKKGVFANVMTKARQYETVSRVSTTRGDGKRERQE